MADTLEIFGVEYTGVTGLVATNDGGTDLTYYRATDGNNLEYGLINATSSMVGVGKVGSMIIK